MREVRLPDSLMTCCFFHAILKCCFSAHFCSGGRKDQKEADGITFIMLSSPACQLSPITHHTYDWLAFAFMSDTSNIGDCKAGRRFGYSNEARTPKNKSALSGKQKETWDLQEKRSSYLCHRPQTTPLVCASASPSIPFIQPMFQWGMASSMKEGAPRAHGATEIKQFWCLKVVT